MYQIDWSNNITLNETVPINQTDILKSKDIEAINFTFWSEHCLECSPPQCYKNCMYYLKRKDGRCKRTEYGLAIINNDNDAAALFEYSVKLKFRPWAKIETRVYKYSMSAKDYKKANYLYTRYVKYINKIKKLNPKALLNNAAYFYITRILTKRKSKIFLPDTFVLKLYSYENQPYNLIIESVSKDQLVIARRSLLINFGFNQYSLNYKDIVSDNSHVVRMYPENNIEAEMILITAEFIKYKNKAENKHNVIPAAKVKCVAWDLDNTIWDGILSENNLPVMQLRNNIGELIIELDKRGILQTIISKNDFDLAWPQLEILGISQYFLYPAINWGQKSNNLQQVATALNINIDSFALIDDSIFERNEVSEFLPQVRVYDEAITDKLLSLDEFNTLITEESIKRRVMYQTEETRNKIKASYFDDYTEFLKSCQICADISIINSSEKKSRCYELLQRTNQLNLTGNKYNEIEFDLILSDPDKTSYSVEVHDKYGGYGIICFFSVSIINNTAVINEFALSCRVAKKHIEYAILLWIAKTYINIDTIIATYKKTNKNDPIFNEFIEIGFIMNNDILSISIDKLTDDGIICIIN